MRFDQRLHEGQAKTQTVAVLAVGPLLIGWKQRLGIIGVNTDDRIPDGNPRVRRLMLDDDLDLATIGVRHRISKQVVEDLRQPFRICIDRHGLRGRLVLEGEPFRAGLRPDGFQRGDDRLNGYPAFGIAEKRGHRDQEVFEQRLSLVRISLEMLQVIGDGEVCGELQPSRKTSENGAPPVPGKIVARPLLEQFEHARESLLFLLRDRAGALRCADDRGKIFCVEPTRRGGRGVRAPAGRRRPRRSQ
jgi:hypothetical protein